jgi:hypothetical protein
MLHQECRYRDFAIGNLNQPQVIVNAMRAERANLSALRHRI